MTMERPLASWSLDAPLRGYQADLLARVSPADGATLHLVAPPGAGKTMLGLALAARNGRRALVLTPTTVIRAQWTEQASRFLRTSDGGAPAVADRIPGAGEEPADLTVLTYQALSVVDSTTPWEAAARSRWLDDLVSDGRTPARADAWLSALAADNPAAYARGLRSRAATIRARIDELDDDAVAALLAPGARERLDALIDAGTATIVLDECHHLRAHWAVVVHYLRRRLAAAGTAPTLIGLTATEPSSEDRSWRRYRALLGDVDAEVPVPAVVRSGHLAPYRPLAWFTLPTPEETSFLTTAGAELRHRIAQYLLAPDGIDYLLGLVHGDLGTSFTGVDTSQRVAEAFPITLQLTFIGIFAAVIVSTVLGITAALYRDKWQDQAIRVISIACLATPSFWLALLLIQWFSDIPGGTGTFPALVSEWVPFSEDPGTYLNQIFLPALAIAVPNAGSLTRVVRTAMVEELDRDYVRTAIGGGIPKNVVVARNVLRNALITPLTVLGLRIGYAMGGAVVIEMIFNIKGMGQLIFQGITRNDVNIVQGVSITVALAFIIINIVVDMLYVLVNPRIRSI